jgi:hypothetical protein
LTRRKLRLLLLILKGVLSPMKKTVKKIEKKMPDLRIQNISLYFRDGKFYWTIKSCGFDSLEEAFADAQLFCKLEDETDD